jgi:hypothetical protein
MTERAGPESMGPAAFGRVDSDGTVYVRTSAGERVVGQVPGVAADEALGFFTRRFESLELEVALLERRIATGAVSPDDAVGSINKLRHAISDARVVGDLDGLQARLEALSPLIADQRAARRAERARQQEETRAAKERFVVEAERLAGGNDWRGGVNRFRALLEEWKALPRLDRATDDALWHRFSSARTTYTRRRKAQFAQQNEQREAARVIKERLVAEAEALASSTDWGPTTGAYRDLMTRWKAAGPAPRDVDELLWKRFRGAQDRFFMLKRRKGCWPRPRHSCRCVIPALPGPRTETSSNGGRPLAGCLVTPCAHWSLDSAPWTMRSRLPMRSAGGAATPRQRRGPPIPRPSWRPRLQRSRHGLQRPRRAAITAPHRRRLPQLLPIASGLRRLSEQRVISEGD